MEGANGAGGDANGADGGADGSRANAKLQLKTCAETVTHLDFSCDWDGGESTQVTD